MVCWPKLRSSAGSARACVVWVVEITSDLRYEVSIEKHQFNQKIGHQLNLIQVWALRGVSAQIAASDNEEALEVTLTLTFL